MVLVTAAISLFLCIVPAEARNPRRASSQIPRSTWAASQGSTARVFTFDGFVTGQAVSSNVNRYSTLSSSFLHVFFLASLLSHKGPSLAIPYAQVCALMLSSPQLSTQKLTKHSMITTAACR